ETIEWGALHVEVPTSARPWPEGAPLIAGVSSFGITGTNAHAVVAAADAYIAEHAGAERTSTAARVVTVSARTPVALDEAALSLRGWLSANAGSVDLSDVSFTTTCRREHHDHRLALVASSVEEVIEALDDHAAAESTGRSITGVAASAPSIAFVFSGQGSQWLGM